MIFMMLAETQKYMFVQSIQNFKESMTKYLPVVSFAKLTLTE